MWKDIAAYSFDGSRIDSRDESATENGRVTSRDGGGLDNDTDDEDGGGDEDGVLSREGLGEETGDEGTEPSTEFEDGGEPALARLVGWVVAVVVTHVRHEVVHGEDTGEDTLVVTCAIDQLVSFGILWGPIGHRSEAACACVGVYTYHRGDHQYRRTWRWRRP